MAKITRAASFRRKTGLRLSKGETALEAAFKELDVQTLTVTTGTVTYTSVPDMVIVPTGLTGNIVIDIVVPAADAQAFNRVVKVVVQDDLVGGETVTVQSQSTGAAVAAASSATEFYIADASAASAPVKL